MKKKFLLILLVNLTLGLCYSEMIISSGRFFEAPLEYTFKYTVNANISCTGNKYFLSGTRNNTVLEYKLLDSRVKTYTCTKIGPTKYDDCSVFCTIQLKRKDLEVCGIWVRYFEYFDNVVPEPVFIFNGFKNENIIYVNEFQTVKIKLLPDSCDYTEEFGSGYSLQKIIYDGKNIISPYSVYNSGAEFEIDVNENGKKLSVELIDNVGNVFKEDYVFVLDNIPPQLNVSDCEDWLNKPVEVYADAYDELSGVDEDSFRVSVDGKNFSSESVNNSSVLISEEGFHAVKFSVMDNCGNVSVSDDSFCKIDLTPPVIKYSGISSDLYCEKINAYFDFYDSLSGINENLILCEVNGKKVSLTNGNLILKDEGKYNVKITVSDNAGNTCGKEFFNISIDRTAPVISGINYSCGDKSFSSGEIVPYDEYLKSAEKIKITPLSNEDFTIEDFISSNADFSIDGGSVIVKNLEDGNFNFSVKIKDFAGNVSELKSDSFYFDSTVPKDFNFNAMNLGDRIFIQGFYVENSPFGFDEYEISMDEKNYHEVSSFPVLNFCVDTEDLISDYFFVRVKEKNGTCSVSKKINVRDLPLLYFGNNDDLEYVCDDYVNFLWNKNDASIKNIFVNDEKIEDLKSGENFYGLLNDKTDFTFCAEINDETFEYKKTVIRDFTAPFFENKEISFTYLEDDKKINIIFPLADDKESSVEKYLIYAGNKFYCKDKDFNGNLTVCAPKNLSFMIAAFDKAGNVSYVSNSDDLFAEKEFFFDGKNVIFLNGKIFPVMEDSVIYDEKNNIKSFSFYDFNNSFNLDFLYKKITYKRWEGYFLDFENNYVLKNICEKDFIFKDVNIKALLDEKPLIFSKKNKPAEFINDETVLENFRLNSFESDFNTQFFNFYDFSDFSDLSEYYYDSGKFIIDAKLNFDSVFGFSSAVDNAIIKNENLSYANGGMSFTFDFFNNNLNVVEFHLCENKIVMDLAELDFFAGEEKFTLKINNLILYEDSKTFDSDSCNFTLTDSFGNEIKDFNFNGFNFNSDNIKLDEYGKFLFFGKKDNFAENVYAAGFFIKENKFYFENISCNESIISLSGYEVLIVEGVFEGENINIKKGKLFAFDDVFEFSNLLVYVNNSNESSVIKESSDFYKMNFNTDYGNLELSNIQILKNGIYFSFYANTIFGCRVFIEKAKLERENKFYYFRNDFKLLVYNTLLEFNNFSFDGINFSSERISFSLFEQAVEYENCNFGIDYFNFDSYFPEEFNFEYNKINLLSSPNGFSENGFEFSFAFEGETQNESLTVIFLGTIPYDFSYETDSVEKYLNFSNGIGEVYLDYYKFYSSKFYINGNSEIACDSLNYDFEKGTVILNDFICKVNGNKISMKYKNLTAANNLIIFESKNNSMIFSPENCYLNNEIIVEGYLYYNNLKINKLEKIVISSENIILLNDAELYFSYSFNDFIFYAKGICVSQDIEFLENELIFNENKINVGNLVFNENFKLINEFSFSTETEASIVTDNDTIFNVHIDNKSVKLDLMISGSDYLSGYNLFFTDVSIYPDGTYFCPVEVPYSAFSFGKFNVEFYNLSVSEKGIYIENTDLTFSLGNDNATFTIHGAKILKSGVLSFEKISSKPFKLWNMTFTLSNLSFSDLGLNLKGNVILSQDCPGILSLLKISLNELIISYDGNLVSCDISASKNTALEIAGGLFISFNDFGFSLNKNEPALYIKECNLYLPKETGVNKISVTGLCFNLKTMAFDFDSVKAKTDFKFDFFGLDFYLTDFIIYGDLSFGFGGSMQFAGENIPDFMKGIVLDNIYVVFNSDGSIKDFNVSVEGLNGYVDKSNFIYLSSGIINLGFENKNLVITASGSFILSDKCPSFISGTSLNLISFKYIPKFNEILEFSASAENISFVVEGIEFTDILLLFDINSCISASGCIVLPEYLAPELSGTKINLESFKIDFDGNILIDASYSTNNDVSITEDLVLNSATIRLHKSFNEPLSFTVTGDFTLFNDLNMSGTISINQSGITSFDAKCFVKEKTLFNEIVISDSLINVELSSSVPYLNICGNVSFLNNKFIPKEISDLKFSIITFKTTLAGKILELDFSVAAEKVSLFDSLELVNPNIDVCLGNEEYVFSFSGDVKITNSYIPEEIKKSAFNINSLKISSRRGLIDFEAGIEKEIKIVILSGLELSLDTINFSDEGFSFSCGAKLNFNGPACGLEFKIKNCAFDWNFNLLEIEGGIKNVSVSYGGFSAVLTDLFFVKDNFSKDGFRIVLEELKVLLPIKNKNSNCTEFVIKEASYCDGKFYCAASSPKIETEITGFKISFMDPKIDIENKNVSFKSCYMILPDFLGAHKIELKEVNISADKGLEFGGLLYRIPDFSVSEKIGFRNVLIGFTLLNGTYEITGGGSVLIPGAGELSANLSFTNVSKEFPIGIKKCFFSFEAAGFCKGLPLGATGLYMSGIRGGLSYGEPVDVPEVFKNQFKSGMRIQLGLTLTDGTGGQIVRMTPDLWIDAENVTFAFKGDITVLEGTLNLTASAYASLSKYGFYSGFKFQIKFVKGSLELYIFTKDNKLKFSGTGQISFGIEKGAIFNKQIHFLWKDINVVIPDKALWLPGIESEFGDFTNGERGFKGVVDIPVVGKQGVFIGTNGIKFKNINSYSIEKPAYISLIGNETNIGNVKTISPLEYSFNKNSICTFTVENDYSFESLVFIIVTTLENIDLQNDISVLYNGANLENAEFFSYAEYSVVSIKEPKAGLYNISIKESDSLLNNERSGFNLSESFYIEAFTTEALNKIVDFNVNEFSYKKRKLDLNCNMLIPGSGFTVQFVEENSGFNYESDIYYTNENSDFNDTVSVPNLPDGNYKIYLCAKDNDQITTDRKIIYEAKILTDKEKMPAVKNFRFVKYETGAVLIWDYENIERVNNFVLKVLDVNSLNESNDFEEFFIGNINNFFIGNISMYENKKIYICALDKYGNKSDFAGPVILENNEEFLVPEIQLVNSGEISVNAGNDFFVNLCIKGTAETFYSVNFVNDKNISCYADYDYYSGDGLFYVNLRFVVNPETKAGLYTLPMEVFASKNKNISSSINLNVNVLDCIPEIKSVDKDVLYNGKSQEITLTGSGFINSSRYFLNDMELTVSLNGIDSTFLKNLIVPENNFLGESFISVVTPWGKKSAYKIILTDKEVNDSLWANEDFLDDRNLESLDFNFNQNADDDCDNKDENNFGDSPLVINVSESVDNVYFTEDYIIASNSQKLFLYSKDGFIRDIVVLPAEIKNSHLYENKIYLEFINGDFGYFDVESKKINHLIFNVDHCTFGNNFYFIFTENDLKIYSFTNVELLGYIKSYGSFYSKTDFDFSSAFILKNKLYVPGKNILIFDFNLNSYEIKKSDFIDGDLKEDKIFLTFNNEIVAAVNNNLFLLDNDLNVVKKLSECAGDLFNVTGFIKNETGLYAFNNDFYKVLGNYDKILFIKKFPLVLINGETSLINPFTGKKIWTSDFNCDDCFVNNNFTAVVSKNSIYVYSGVINNSGPEISFYVKEAGKNERIVDLNQWIKNPVYVKISAFDRETKSEAILYSVNGYEFNKYSEELLLKDGKYTVSAISYDTEKLYGEIKDINLNIDSTKPTVDFYVNNEPVKNTLFHNPVEINVKAFDSLSGVKEIYLNGNKITGPFILNREGIYTLTAYAVDNAGNYSKEKSVELTLDFRDVNLVPVITEKSGVTELEFFSHGNFSVEEIYVSVDDSVFDLYTQKIFISKTGWHTVKYKAVDVAGKESRIFEKKIFVNPKNIIPVQQRNKKIKVSKEELVFDFKSVFLNEIIYSALKNTKQIFGTYKFLSPDMSF